MHSPDGKNNDIKSLLIVDESVAEGMTDAAIMDHLRVADTPKETKVTLGYAAGWDDGPTAENSIP